MSSNPLSEITMNPIFTSDRHALALFASAFPDTRFKSVKLYALAGPMSLNSYWQDGYRDYFKFVNLSTGQTVASVAQNGTPFDGANYELSTLPEGFAICMRSYMGTRESGTIYLNAVNLAPLLPPSVELTWAERVCLAATRGLKPHCRFDSAQRDTKITLAEWNEAKQSLTAKRYLMANGSITNDGRNAIGTTSTYSLKRAE